MDLKEYLRYAQKRREILEAAWEQLARNYRPPPERPYDPTFAKRKP